VNFASAHTASVSSRWPSPLWVAIALLGGHRPSGWPSHFWVTLTPSGDHRHCRTASPYWAVSLLWASVAVLTLPWLLSCTCRLLLRALSVPSLSSAPARFLINIFEPWHAAKMKKHHNSFLSWRDKNLRDEVSVSYLCVWRALRTKGNRNFFHKV
jgi:hypothetical protein